jgi:hypothetical protein
MDRHGDRRSRTRIGESAESVIDSRPISPYLLPIENSRGIVDFIERFGNDKDDPRKDERDPGRGKSYRSRVQSALEDQMGQTIDRPVDRGYRGAFPIVFANQVGREL